MMRRKESLYNEMWLKDDCSRQRHTMVNKGGSEEPTKATSQRHVTMKA